MSSEIYQTPAARFFNRIASFFKEDKEKVKETTDAEALEKFRKNVTIYRIKYGYANKAPLFDYSNWKQFDATRENSSPDEFIMQACALAPYVTTVLHTGCIGEGERKWAKLTGVAYEESLMKSAHNVTSMPASLRASRQGSKARLA